MPGRRPGAAAGPSRGARRRPAAAARRPRRAPIPSPSPVRRRRRAAAPPRRPAPAGRRRWPPAPCSVEVEIAAACPVPAVRAFLVVKKLSGLGAVVRTTPTVEELKAGRLPGQEAARCSWRRAEPLDRLERALSQISDLGAVTVRAQDEAAGRAGPAAAPAAPGRATPAAAEPSRTVRVRTEMLDGFVDTVGELLLATARIREVGRTLPGRLPPAARRGGRPAPRHRQGAARQGHGACA